MKTLERPILLSTLWLFVLLNFIYCDVLGLHDPHTLTAVLSGRVGDLEMTPTFLLGASLLMEIPIAMVLVARIARRAVTRVASIVAAAFMVLVQSASLFVGVPSLSYAFFSVIEIATLVVIAVVAARWTAAASAELKSEVIPA